MNTTDIRNIISVMYVSYVITYNLLLLFISVPKENKDMITSVNSYTLAGLGVILGYYFVANKKDKEDVKTTP